MSLPQLPAGQAMGLYASDAFLMSAYEVGARQLDINTGEVNDVIRMARASGTVPKLGGIALLVPEEVQPAAQDEIVKYGEALAGDVVQEQVILNEFVRGQIVSRDSWGRVIVEHGAEGKSLFSLGSSLTRVGSPSHYMKQRMLCQAESKMMSGLIVPLARQGARLSRAF